MNGVGTEQGNTYNNDEGKGLAYLLPKSDAIENIPTQLNTAMQIELERQKLGAAKDKAEAAKKDKATAKLDKAKPDWWWVHDKELKGEVNNVMNMGAELIAAGIDPFSDTDEASVKFREKMDRATQKGVLSTQLRSNYDKDRAIATDKGEKFTTESIDGNIDPEKGWYATNSLDKILETGDVPPTFKFKQPQVDLEKLARTSSEAVHGEGVPTADDYNTMALAHFAIPENKAQATQVLADMKNDNPDYYKDLENRAAVAKQPVDVYYMGKLIESYRPDVPAATQLKDALKDMKVGQTTIGRAGESVTGVSTSSTTTKTDVESAKTMGALVANERPGLVEKMAAEKWDYWDLKQNADGTYAKVGEPKIVTDKKSAGDYFAYKHLLEANFSKTSKQGLRFFDEEAAASGKGVEEVAKDNDFYEQAIRGTITNLSHWVPGAPDREMTYAEMIRLRDWTLGQATGLELPGEKGFIITDNIKTTDENDVISTQRTGVLTETGTGEDFSSELGAVNFATSMTDAKGVQLQKNKSYLVNPKSQGEKDYLTSGTLDLMHRGTVKNKKKLVVDQLAQDWGLIFQDQNAPVDKSNLGGVKVDVQTVPKDPNEW